MKAALMYGPNDIRVEETEKPACPENGLILKIMAVGLCGSDIRNLTTDSRKGNYPFTTLFRSIAVRDCGRSVRSRQFTDQIPNRPAAVPLSGNLLHGM